MNRDADCSKHLDVTHYVLIRGDLPRGVMGAQIIHAAGESAITGLKPGTLAVLLDGGDEKSLAALGDELDRAGIANHRVLECDGELMAIGLEPVTDRTPIRKVLSKVPLLR